jgi:hypothetical protein
MEWGYAAIAGVFVVGVLLAFPVAIGICAALGGFLMAVDRLTTGCPGCRLRFYLCRACGGRWFWSKDDRAWQDASSPDFAWAFVEG